MELLAGYARRKRWEARVHAAELLDALGMVMGRKPKKVSTAEGLAAMGVKL